MNEITASLIGPLVIVVISFIAGLVKLRAMMSQDLKEMEERLTRRIERLENK